MPPRRAKKSSTPPTPNSAYAIGSNNNRDVKVAIRQNGRPRRPGRRRTAAEPTTESEEDSDDGSDDHASNTGDDDDNDDDTEEHFVDDRDELARHLVSSEGRRVRVRVPPPPVTSFADRLLGWVDALEFATTWVLAILIFAFLQTWPHAQMETPAGFWFLSISIIWHVVGTTFRPNPSLLLSLVNILLDILMIVFLSLKRLWDTGLDIDAQRIRDHADIAIAIYAFLLFCSLLRLLLFLKLCSCCSPPLPRTRHAM